MNKKTRFYGGAPAPAAQAQQSSQTVQPWSGIQPSILNQYQMAAKAFANGPQQYTPWSQAANLTPDQLAQINGTAAYVNSKGTQQMMQNQSNAVQGMMNDANNPYKSLTAATNPMLSGYLQNNNLQDTGAGINHFLYQDSSDPALQSSISSATDQVNQALGHNTPGSSGVNSLIQGTFGFGKNIANNIQDINQEQATNTALSNGFNSQNANRLKAIGLANGINNNKATMAADLMNSEGQYKNNSLNMGYSNYVNALTNPLQMLTQLNNVGAMEQQQNQSQLDNASNAWNFAQNAPYQNLQNYANMINPNPTWGNTFTNNAGSNQQAGANPWALAAGGGASLAGLGAGIYANQNKGLL